MRMKGETVDEIVGFARAMRERATPVRPTVTGYIDTCGTGGDGLHTFNISTTTAFVVAGAGVPVAKHGNRAVSSAAGSADVLEALGVDISLDADRHGALHRRGGRGLPVRAVAARVACATPGPTRREIGIRTVFNILGPLTNPRAPSASCWASTTPLAPVMAEVAGRLGAERVLVVNGHPGMDEVSASGPTTVAEFDVATGGVRTYEITPEQVGIARGTLADIAGGDAAENAAIVRSVLLGEDGPATRRRADERRRRAACRRQGRRPRRGRRASHASRSTPAARSRRSRRSLPSRTRLAAEEAAS